MTMSQTQFLREVLGDGPIPTMQLIYFRQRMIGQLFNLVLTEFDRLSKSGKITKASLARRIGRDPALITRWLSGPGNRELETISDLLLGMKCEPAVTVRSLVLKPPIPILQQLGYLETTK